MEQTLTYHNSVMLIKSIEGLNIKSNGIYIDITFGSGGHSKAILQHLDQTGKLFAFDQDQDSKQNLINDSRFTFINHNFKHIKNHLEFYGIKKVDGILGDLGVSSHQFDCENRGFSYRFDCPLDMRMDTRKSLKASDILNTYDEIELIRIFSQYGEIHNASKLARLIVSERKIMPFAMSQDLINRIKSCTPKYREFKYLAQLYQSLRIEVNGEINALRSLLEQSISLLNSKGRLVMISYHSLEDRIVKIFMRSGNFEDKIEKDMYGNDLSPFSLINRKAIVPDERELGENNRSRSAKLRIAERRQDGK
jgi:16S rRNA (cytosine1402-N4)-methyltransferase